MTILFDAKKAEAGEAEPTSERKPVPEATWRSFDFGMDCLIPAEDYAVPKGMTTGDK
ncbi:hypothetical protein ACRARG_08810 [Pseudooceanicola sp. C21-150M6]|uniref:hypothetical protein n=1 Tax=Pseudooceanicola sp. C21-150M6 TaxID=3434355 RepID=UPI003D7F1D33